MNTLDIDTYKKFLQTLVCVYQNNFEFDEYKPHNGVFIYERGTELYNLRDLNYQHLIYWIYDTFIVSIFKTNSVFTNHLEVIDFLYRNVDLSKTTYLVRDTKLIKEKITRTNLSIKEKEQRLKHIIDIYNSY